MKHAIAFGILVSAMPLLFGQQSASPAQRDSPFQWNDSDVRELGPDNALRKTSAISPSERKALAALLEKQMSDSGLTGAQLREAVFDTRVIVANLGRSSDVIAQAAGEDSGCSPTGNCPIWVFEKTATGYKVILEADAVQTFTIQRTRTNGHLDLVLGQHGSAFERELRLYRFANGSYQQTACYAANWTRLVGDDLQELKKPDITPCQRP